MGTYKTYTQRTRQNNHYCSIWRVTENHKLDKPAIKVLGERSIGLPAVPMSKESTTDGSTAK